MSFSGGWDLGFVGLVVLVVFSVFFDFVWGWYNTAYGWFACLISWVGGCGYDLPSLVWTAGGLYFAGVSFGWFLNGDIRCLVVLGFGLAVLCEFGRFPGEIGFV